MREVKDKLNELWTRQIVRRSFRITLYAIIAVVAIGVSIGLDFGIAGHYRTQALTQQIFSGTSTYYDHVEVRGQSVYVKGVDTDIAGALYCYDGDDLAKTIPLSKKIDKLFNANKVGEHEDYFTYNQLQLRYVYNVVEPYSEADGTPESCYLSNVSAQYAQGEDFDISGIITVLLSTGKTIQLPLRKSYVPDFDTSLSGEFSIPVLFEVGQKHFEEWLVYTVS